jgi:hypothetical protein
LIIRPSFPPLHSKLRSRPPNHTESTNHHDSAVNPNTTQLGPLIDETGQLSSGKVIFSDTAWQQLLGRSPAQLTEEPGSQNKFDGGNGNGSGTLLDVLTFMEHRMRFLRVSLGFGWCLEGTTPEKEGVDLEKWGRKRKRVDVIRKAEGEGEGEAKRLKIYDANTLAENESGNGTGSKGVMNKDDENHPRSGSGGDNTGESSGPSSSSSGAKGNSNSSTSTNGTASQLSANNNGIGEVGRLCIWCVKM